MMYLNFEQKREILRSYKELREGATKPDKINYYFDGSNQQGKKVISELRHTGNGYARGKYLENYEGKIDSRGWINIRDLSELELREIINKVVASFNLAR